jgi:hypothetical protein
LTRVGDLLLERPRVELLDDLGEGSGVAEHAWNVILNVQIIAANGTHGWQREVDSKKGTNKSLFASLLRGSESFVTSVPTRKKRMPAASVIHVAVFAAGAALGATAAALAQRRNDRLTTPATAAVSTSTIPRNIEISRIPVVEVSATGKPGLAQFQGISSDVLKYGNPGESLYPFICRSTSLI